MNIVEKRPFEPLNLNLDVLLRDAIVSMCDTPPPLEKTGDGNAIADFERQLIELIIAHQKHIESLKHAIEEKRQGLVTDSPTKLAAVATDLQGAALRFTILKHDSKISGQIRGVLTGQQTHLCLN